MKSIRDELIAASKDHGGRRGEIDLWSAIHPEEAEELRAYIAEFVAVRQDGAYCSFQQLKKILETRLSLRVSQNTLTKWVRKQYPDEPSLKH